MRRKLAGEKILPINAAVIVAAGRGERLGTSEGPKQYRILNGKSVLQRTIEQFVGHPDIDLVQVVIHKDDFELYENAVSSHQKLLSPVEGGRNRQASCKAGVDGLDGHGVDKVLIHDAARPFVSSAVISDVLGSITPGHGALPAIAVADTIKKADADRIVEETIPRDDVYLAQTPQGFFFDEIRNAHQKVAAETDQEFTDDAAVAEHAGMRMKLSLGDQENFKITTMDDFRAAEEKTGQRPMNFPDIRTGSGYDVHTLGPGDGVILGGIKIPHVQSLQGHSDADVVLHSLTDALLGTMGAGDIGDHFPPSDPKWKGADSDQFLEHAVSLVTQQNGKITNLDVTIVCEAPNIGPHRDVMRQRIAEICALETGRVSVKATTNEKIGFIGRGEGIAALATATVLFE